jgi:DNA mismatch repair protein MutS
MNSSRHLLITGPNMAGKSTIMRQVALIVILNQIGCYVPALQAKLPVFDNVYTRVGAADDIYRGQSTFMVEMSEAAAILRNATPRSLVILDEVGRGTSTEDGLAIAFAILKDLAERVGCYSLFATHYHELVALCAETRQVAAMQTEVKEEHGTIVFTHRLVKGASGSSYGIEVAKIAGVTQTVIDTAPAFIKDQKSFAPALEKPAKTAERVTGASAKLTEAENSLPLESGGLFAQVLTSAENETIEKLRKINLNRLTPIQVVNIINDLQTDLNAPKRAGLFAEEYS